MNKPMKIKPHFYAVCFGELQKIARDHGYNLLIHGSLDRDMDLVAVPWIDMPCTHIELIQAFDDYLNGKHQETSSAYMFSILPGGRSAYVVNLHRSYYCPHCEEYKPDAQYYLDISITPYYNKTINIRRNFIMSSEKLSTIQKRENLNVIYPRDEKGAGGANHLYEIISDNETRNTMGIVQFQNGPRKDENAISGVIDTDLLEIVRHRLQCFQADEFSSRENACALTHIEEALMWLNRRVEDRIERNVLGTYNK